MANSKNNISKLKIFGQIFKKNFLYLALLGSIYWVKTTFQLTDQAEQIVIALLSVLIFIIVIKSTFILIDLISDELEVRFPKQSLNKVITNSLKLVIVVISILTVINNLGVNISSLLTGVGIGGIAIAFAVQNILSDLFSSISIHLDKPFTVGDTIKVGKHVGTVKKIGLKSTRIKLLKGTELILSNKVISETEVINIKRMQKRRVGFKLSLSYNNSLVKIKKIPKIIEKIIENIPKADLVRVNLSELNKDSLNYDIVYRIPTREYALFTQIQEEIYLTILGELQKAKIEMSQANATVLLGSDNISSA